MKPQQVLGRSAGERVDRLVVVAHDAEVVARPEPPIEQPRLEQVHVLVLVHGERVEPGADDLRGLRMLVEEPQGEAQHVLEVEAPHRALASLVPLVDPQHQLRGDRGLVGLDIQLGEVPVRRDRPVLGPFDLAGELAAGEELVRRRQGVRERSDQRRLVVEHLGERLAGVRRPEPRELRQGGRVERARFDALDVERAEPALQLPRGLLREGDREDLRSLERAAPDLARDAPRDGGGLARAGTCQDRDRSAEREGCFALGIVQPGEDAVQVAHEPDPSTGSSGSRAADHTCSSRTGSRNWCSELKPRAPGCRGRTHGG